MLVQGTPMNSFTLPPEKTTKTNHGLFFARRRHTMCIHDEDGYPHFAGCYSLIYADCNSDAHSCAMSSWGRQWSCSKIARIGVCFLMEHGGSAFDGYSRFWLNPFSAQFRYCPLALMWSRTVVDRFCRFYPMKKHHLDPAITARYCLG